ncbi:MAG: transposase [Candidatus Methanomethylophilaceae archaeon]|nr:transposase [Candidatus Methanomethylophilaceae archaeon]
MTRFRSAKFRLYPSRAQRRQMDSVLELCRSAYNREVEMCRKAYEADGTFLSQDSIQEYCDYVLKLEDPRLEEVFPDCLNDVSRRVFNSFNKFRQLQSTSKEKLVPPSPKSSERYGSFSYPKFKRNVRLEVEGKIWLHGIGEVKCVVHRRIDGAPFSCTISRSPTGKWYAVISFIQNNESESKISPKGDNPVGVDLGLYNLAVFSDGTVYDNKKLFDKMVSDMAKIQRKMGLYEVGTAEHQRYKRRLVHLFEHYNSRVKDEMHKRSTEVVETYSMIALEDIDVKEMIEHYHTRAGRRSQSTAAWRTFVEMIEYKADESGVQVVFVNPMYTSQVCSACRSFVHKGLGVRVHECPICGLVLDRDVNAARNILRIGLGMQASVTGNRNSRISI